MPDAVTQPFQFHGTSREYFRIWYVNTLLSVLTLGLYSPWAKVRRLRYFYGNTRLAGHSFDYSANPWGILCARLLVILGLFALALLVPLITFDTAGSDLLYNAILLLLLPWALVRGIAFNARYSIYRAACFRFIKRYAPAYRFVLWIVTPFLLIIYGTQLGGESLASSPSHWGALPVVLRAWFIICLLLLLIFWYYLPNRVRDWHQFKISHYRLGPLHFHFALPSLRGYRIALWVLPILGILITFAILVLGWPASGEILGYLWLPLMILSIYLTLLFTIGLIGALLARIQWNAARFTAGAQHGRITANFSLAAFAWLHLTNLLAILVSFGMLYPWTRIRRARFFLRRLSATFPPELLNTLAIHHIQGESALGGELDSAEGFDFDVGII